MGRRIWTPERLDELRGFCAAGGITQREIAEKMGLRYHQIVAAVTTYKIPYTIPRTATGKHGGMVLAHKLRKEQAVSLGLGIPKRVRGGLQHPLAVKGALLVEVLTGRLSGNMASDKYNVNPITIRRWLKNPELLNMVAPLVAEIKARDLRISEAELAAIRAINAEKAALAAKATLDRQENNEKLYPLMKERHVGMCKAYIDGNSMEDVGKIFGVTRERVRQIVTAARDFGVQFPPEKRISGRPPRLLPLKGSDGGRTRSPDREKARQDRANMLHRRAAVLEYHRRKAEKNV